MCSGNVLAGRATRNESPAWGVASRRTTRLNRYDRGGKKN